MNESTDHCNDSSESTPVAASENAPSHGIGSVVVFRVFGLARYLSHAEMMRVFHRACVRAELALVYSHGYNPRPRLSLPLPKPVGVESEGDLMCLRLTDLGLTEEALASNVALRLSAQLPQGLEILSVRIVPRRVSYQAEAAQYRFPLKAAVGRDELQAKARAMLACESLVVDRREGDEGTSSRRVDVRPFLESVDVADHELNVHFRIFPNGSIRVGEILELLGLTKGQLAGPIRRTAIQWRQTLS